MISAAPIIWCKSSYSSQGGDCVEIGFSARKIFIRDTKCRSAGYLSLSPAAWVAFRTAAVERD
jgi:hypothetical protein